MNSLQKQYNSHKLNKFGIWICLIGVLSYALLSAILMTGCKSDSDSSMGITNNNIIDHAVIVLNPSDVADYNKYYKPQEFNNMNLLRSDSKWSFVRSRQSAHFFVFWEAGFGDNPNATTVPEALRVDIDDMLAKIEQFYSMNVNSLRFAHVGNGKSNLDKYKMQIYLLYQTDWAAYGGGYDDVIGALWINPATCKPVGSVIAHEIGHSFQYQVYADALANGECNNDFSRGFRYGFGGNGGNGFWEQSAQWQSYQSYPLEAFESYNFSVYADNCHRHFGHEWQRYASYFLLYYWADKFGVDYIGKIWRESKSPEDPIEAHVRLNNLTNDQLTAELYEAATRFVTWDLDAIRANGTQYIGKQSYKFHQLEDGSYQVAYSRCPSSTGYNIISLNVPTPGTVISIKFKGLTPGSALAPGDPGQYSDDEKTITTTKYNSSSPTRAGWRYGYVALLSSGERVYGEMNRKTTDDVLFTVPQGCTNIWFVVLGAPSDYRSCPWDEKESNDDQWPYSVKFTNTDLLNHKNINTNTDSENSALTNNSTNSADATNYSGAIVN